MRFRGRKSVLDNLPGPSPTSWFSGAWLHDLPNLEFLLSDTICRRLERVLPSRPAKWVHVWDTKALHALFIKGQDYYLEHLFGMGSQTLEFKTMRILIGHASGIFATEGEQHRRQRRLLNPVFSTKHLRRMVPLFYQVIHQLDMLSWMGRMTLEIIGQVGFGHTFDDFTSDEPDAFRTALKSFFPQMMKSHKRHISDVSYEQSVRIFTEKRAALTKGDEMLKHEIGEGRDIMSILLRENILASSEDPLPDDELIALQTSRLERCSIRHLDVQEKLREEILRAVETDGDGEMLDFDRLMDLPYLEAVCRESFKSECTYPSVACLFREATEDMLLPLSKPIRMLNGSTLLSLPIPRGTRLIPNMAACNVDPMLWGPDASEGKPEHWLKPVCPGYILICTSSPGSPCAKFKRILKPIRHRITFLRGNKACIGFKFAQIELKVVLLVLLQRFRFDPTEEAIAWNSAPVQYPTVGKVSEEPALPLKILNLAKSVRGPVVR
ncbi:cytochrome P450 [Ganoderma leucocontextum]|nr:cytochrome P450 [Ganoderma leucocontextum]